MYKPDEKDIDRLSREAAEHYHAPGKPNWNALQQILDNELPQEKEKKRRGFLFFFLLLMGLSLAVSGLWYGTHNINRKSVIAGAAPTKAAKRQTAPAKATAAGPVAAGDNTRQLDNHTAADGNAVAAAPGAEENKPGVPAGNTPDSKRPLMEKENGAANSLAGRLPGAANAHQPSGGTNIEKNKTANSRPLQTAASTKKINTVAAHSSKGATDNNTSTTTLQPNKKQAHSGSSQQHISITGMAGSYKDGIAANRPYKKGSGRKKGTTATTVTPEEKATDETATASTAGNSLDKTATTTENNNTGIVQADATTTSNKKGAVQPVMPDTAVNTIAKNTAPAAKKKAAKNQKAINIGLVAGMDFSTVKFTHGDNAGYTFGLTGGYQFSKKWAVYTGALYTKKNYALDGSDYHPPKHYWTQYVKLETVEGYCKMWEFPLLARYTVNPGAKIAFFASTGLSTYIMKEQAYNYNYKTNAGQAMSAAWTNDSTFNHVFSILHLSAGIEKQLGKHMNWQIEPYAKIPLGGVGFGNIRLSSFGINLSVQYRKVLKP